MGDSRTDRSAAAVSGFDAAPAHRFEPSPFDTPPFDPVTGELFGDPVEPVVVAEPVPSGLLSAVLAERGADAIGAAASLSTFTGELRAALEHRISTEYDALMSARPAGPVTQAVVAPELQWLADAHEVLSAIGKVFAEQSAGVKSLASDVVLEVRRDLDIERTGGSASVKVGARGAGQAVKVTTTQPTDVYTDTAVIVDVLVAHMLAVSDAGPAIPLDETTASVAYAAGARGMADALLGLHDVIGLLSAPKWKSTALDLLRETLEAGGVTGVALATRLRDGYGRRPHGKMSTTIERTELKQTRDV